MTKRAVSVVVVGGGVAGGITAILLARAGIDVLLCERSGRGRVERGEVLAAEGRAALSRLGLWDLLRPAAQPCRSIRSAWTSATPGEHSSITNPYGCDWHVDKFAFSSQLLDEAVRAGAQVAQPISVVRASLDEIAWRLELVGGSRELASARIVVDAGGRAPAAHRWLPVTATREDALCAVISQASAHRSDDGLLVEAIEDGWCYSIAPTSDNAIAAFVSDADLIKAMGGARPALMRALGNAPLTEARLRGIGGPVAIVRAGTTTLDRAAGDRWLAVGDAAIAHDPLAGRGNLFAIRSATLAATAIGECLAGDQLALHRYGKAIERSKLAYLAERRAVYSRQNRWPEKPFWKRRSYTNERNVADERS